MQEIRLHMVSSLFTVRDEGILHWCHQGIFIKINLRSQQQKSAEASDEIRISLKHSSSISSAFRNHYCVLSLVKLFSWPITFSAETFILPFILTNRLLLLSVCRRKEKARILNQSSDA